MDRFKNRRLNLEQLAIKFGSRNKLAEVLGVANSEIGNYFGKSPRDITDKKASEYELKLDLPQGYLDKSKDRTDTYPVPVYDISLSAGSGCSVFNETPMKYYPLNNSVLSEEGWRGDKLCVFKIKGESMEPTIIEGQEVLVNTIEQDIIDNRIYAIRIKDEVFIKRLFKDMMNGQIIIRSDNKQHPEYSVEKLNIIGRVVLLLARKV